MSSVHKSRGEKIMSLIVENSNQNNNKEFGPMPMETDLVDLQQIPVQNLENSDVSSENLDGNSSLAELISHPHCSNEFSQSSELQVVHKDLLLSSEDDIVIDDTDADEDYLPSFDEHSNDDMDNVSNVFSDNNVDSTKSKRRVRYKTVVKQQGRKRMRRTENWLYTNRKERYAGGREYISKKGKHVMERKIKPPCSCRMQCSTKISEEDRLQIFNLYWDKNKSNDTKRQFICSCLEVTPIVRSRKVLNTKPKENSLFYHFKINNVKVKVCKVMFLNTLAISNTVVVNVVKKMQPGGLVKPDQRGKHTPSNKTPEVVIKHVITHISSFPAYESHYSRERTQKKYLGSTLTVTKMYELFVEFCSVKKIPTEHVADEWLYRHVFNTKFNLSFKPPELDTCDTCDEFKAQIRGNLTELEKNKVETEYSLHISESKTRYDMKRSDIQHSKETLNHVVISADLQKCLPVPLLTNSLSFYKRKLWTLNYTIYNSRDGSAHCMMWDESKGGRGGNEIASGILKWAETVIPNSSTEEITIWSDNCFGQNKNIVLVMCFFYILKMYPQIKVINQKFLLKGHTHMEADGVHGVIERKRKQLPGMTILTPWDWQQLIRQCSSKYIVHNMELQNLKDFKSLYSTKDSPFMNRKTDSNKEPVLISKSVHLQVRQGEIGKLFFKTDFGQSDFKMVNLKRKVRASTIEFPPTILPVRNTPALIATKKFDDIMSLLPFLPTECHMFYKNLHHSSNGSNYPDDEDVNTV